MTTTNMNVTALEIDAQSGKCTGYNTVQHSHPSGFLDAGTHEDDTVLVAPPPILVIMHIVEPNYSLAPNKDKPAHLVQSHIHPSLWFIVEGPLAERSWIPAI